MPTVHKLQKQKESEETILNSCFHVEEGIEEADAIVFGKKGTVQMELCVLMFGWGHSVMQFYEQFILLTNFTGSGGIVRHRIFFINKTPFPCLMIYRNVHNFGKLSAVYSSEVDLFVWGWNLWADGGTKLMELKFNEKSQQSEIESLKFHQRITDDEYFIAFIGQRKFLLIKK